MTFLFPLWPWSLLGGLALLSIPVLIHLIMRQKPKTLPFPAFRFLLQRHRTNLRKLRLRHLFLLLLRMLLLVVICLVLTRPRIFSEQLNLASDRPVAAVLIFDTSFSMDYKTTGGPSRLDEAKKRGLELLDQLPEGSRIAVLDTAEVGPSGKGAWTTSLAQAREQITGLRLREANGPVTARLESAYRLLADLAVGRDDDRGRRLPRLLCVLSDRTRACWDTSRLGNLEEAAELVPPPPERLQKVRDRVGALIELLGQLRKEVPPPSGQDYPEQALIDLWQQLRDRSAALDPEDYPDPNLATLLPRVRGRSREMLRLLRQARESARPEAKDYLDKLSATLRDGLQELRGVHQVFVDVGALDPVNLGIVGLDLPLEAGGAAARQTFAPDEKVLLRASIQATGKDYETSVLCQVGGKTVPQPLVLKAGQTKTIPFEVDCSNLAPGPHQVEVRLATSDLLVCDNVRFATFAVREPRKVLVLTDTPDKAQGWKRAVEARQEARFRCTVRAIAAAGQVGPGELADYQAVYLLNVARPSPALWGALKEYVDNGGGVAVIPGGKEMDLAAYDDLAARAMLPGKLKTIVAEKDPGTPWDWNEDRIYQHPLLKPVREWRDTGRDDFIKLPRGATFFWDVQPTADATVIVRYTAGKRPALLERRMGRKDGRRGRVLLFTTRLDSDQEPRWNNYMETVTSFCVVLPGLTTAYLAGDTEEVRLNFISGQGLPEVRLPLAGRAPLYTLQGPGVLETVPVGEGQNVLAFKEAVAPGNYVVEDRERTRIGAFSVNLPSEECLLTRVPVEEIEALLGPGAVVPVEQQANLLEALHGHWDQPFELLPLLLLLLLLLLAVENFLSNLFYRREPQPQTVEST